jgi:DNA-binding MarR family transcriptional regulator
MLSPLNKFEVLRLAQQAKGSFFSTVSKESKLGSLELEYELTKALARVLSNCASQKTLAELRRSLTIEQTSLSRFIGYLNQNGYVVRVKTPDGDAFKQTEKGARLLAAFVTLYRAAGASRKPLKLVTNGYDTCDNCAPHRLYPATPPITLHIDGQCQVCNRAVQR